MTVAAAGRRESDGGDEQDSDPATHVFPDTPAPAMVAGRKVSGGGGTN